MFLVYYGMGQFDLMKESFLWPLFKEAYFCALFTFSLNTCAYTTEIFRGAIVATPHGEIEAARASLDFVGKQLGWSSVIHVILEGNEASMAVARKLGSEWIRTQQGLPGVTDERVLIYGQSLSKRG